MICIILVATVDSALELDLAGSNITDGPAFANGAPKALLHVAGVSMLDHWWGIVTKQRSISQIYLVSSAAKYKHFERWATARGLPVANVINDGVTSGDMR
jgi:glucuronokinase